MKVLYLSYDGLTDPLGQSQILPYLFGLTKQGHSFDLISFEKSKNYEKEKKMIEQFIADYSIQWHPQTYHKKPPILSTLYDIWKMYMIAQKLIRSNAIELIHARSYLSGLVALYLKRKLGIRFLFDIRGFWADERVDGGLWSVNNPLYRLIYRYFKKKEILLMQTADHIISLTHAGKEEISSGNLFRGKANGIEKEKVTVIPCAVDLDLFDPKKINKKQQDQLREKLNLVGKKKVLIYLGSIGTWYLLDEMLEYFKKFQAEHPEAVFLFITKDDRQLIMSAAYRIGVAQNTIKIISVQRHEVPLHLSLGSKGIFFIKETYSKKASSAVKMGEMMAMNLTIVCNKTGDVGIMTQKTGQIFQGLKLVEINQGRSHPYFDNYQLRNGIENYSSIYSYLTPSTS